MSGVRFVSVDAMMELSDQKGSSLLLTVDKHVGFAASIDGARPPCRPLINMSSLKCGRSEVKVAQQPEMRFLQFRAKERLSGLDHASFARQHGYKQNVLPVASKATTSTLASSMGLQTVTNRVLCSSMWFKQFQVIKIEHHYSGYSLRSWEVLTRSRTYAQMRSGRYL